MWYTLIMKGVLKMLKVEEILNMVATQWGLEDEGTVEMFRMAERGATAEEMMEYKTLREGAMTEEWFGFDE